MFGRVTVRLVLEVPDTFERDQNFGQVYGVWNDRSGVVFAQIGTVVTVVLTNDGPPPLQLFLRPPVAVQPNGGFVGLRSLTNVAGRCNPDGSVDNSYVTPVVGTNDTVGITDIAAQADGKVIVGSGHSASSPFQGLRDGLVRLNADGSHDTTFKVNAPLDVLRVRVLSDSKVLGGRFWPAVKWQDRVGRGHSRLLTVSIKIFGATRFKWLS